MRMLRALNYPGLRWLLPAVAVFMGWPAPAAPWDYRLNIDVGDALYIQNNDLARLGDGVDFAAHSRHNLLYASPALLLSQGKRAKVYLSCDLLWQYERYTSSEDDYSDSTFDGDLTGAYLHMDGERFGIAMGIQPILFGNGLISLDDGPALSITAKHKQWSLTGLGGLILDQAPIAGLTLTYGPSMFDNVSVFGVWFEGDETREELSWIDEVFGDLYRVDEEAATQAAVDQYRFIELTENADLKWFGAAFELLLGRVYLTATAAYEWGDITVNHLYSRGRKNLNAYLADISAAGNLTPWLGLEIFFFTASGNGRIGGGTLETFLSPLPNNTRALIFFDPAWLDHDPTETLTFGGTTFYGVAAPGMTLTVAPGDRLLFSATWGLFYPQKAPRTDRDFYGWEMDLDLSYQLNRRTDLYLEAAYFSYGSFFENQFENQPDGSLDGAVHVGAGCRFFF